ncbi:MAG: 50S ribosomal protein L6 [Planctomycetes bacterium]|nr:50S ribosomal protein L6 [Planctomycetota bacterium]
MSRIGKKTIAIPKGVTITCTPQKVTVKGSKGELTLTPRPEVGVEVANGEIKVTARDEERTSRAYQGTTRALLASMIVGVSQGYEKKLEINGVGYQATAEGKNIALALGFNKPVKFTVPSTVTVDIPTPTSLVIKGIDKQQVGMVAAAIRKLRKPEPYKGKGIKYSDEVIRRKAGKAFASGGAA